MRLLSVDPANVNSAYVLIDTDTFQIYDFGKVENSQLIKYLRESWYDVIAIEMIASYGMAVGQEVFETCVFIGRLIQIAEILDVRADRVYRKDVKLNLCGAPRAKDGNVIQALKDRFGVKGTKACHGYFYGFKADCWQAYAVAVTWIDDYKNKQKEV